MRLPEPGCRRGLHDRPRDQPSSRQSQAWKRSGAEWSGIAKCQAPRCHSDKTLEKAWIHGYAINHLELQLPSCCQVPSSADDRRLRVNKSCLCAFIKQDTFGSIDDLHQMTFGPATTRSQRSLSCLHNHNLHSKDHFVPHRTIGKSRRPPLRPADKSTL